MRNVVSDVRNVVSDVRNVVSDVRNAVTDVRDAVLDVERVRKRMSTKMSVNAALRISRHGPKVPVRSGPRSERLSDVFGRLLVIVRTAFSYRPSTPTGTLPV